MNNLNEILKDRVISEINTDENTVVIHLKPKEKPLPKSWAEFCEMFPIKQGECFINAASEIYHYRMEKIREETLDRNVLPDRATVEAVLALCQLIRLRNCYNGDWIPDWGNRAEKKYCIEFAYGDIYIYTKCVSPSLLYFKSEELCDEFLNNFRPLIEKLKPLYGIKEGGVKINYKLNLNMKNHNLKKYGHISSLTFEEWLKLKGYIKEGDVK